MLAKTGQFKEAFDVYKALLAKTKHKSIPKDIIYRYSLSQLRFLLRRNYSDYDKIRTELNSIDPILELNAKALLLDRDLFDAANYLINQDFVYWRVSKAKDLLDDIRHNYHLDQLGGFSNNSKTDSLVSLIILMDIESEENGIYVNDFQDYQMMSHLLLEGYIISYMTNSGISSKVKEFNSSLVAYFINNCYPDDVNRLFRDNGVTSLKYSSENVPLNHNEEDRLKYYSRSIPYINKFISESVSNKNYHLEQKLNYIFQNSTLFLKYIEIEESTFNNCVKYLLQIAFKASFLHERSYVILNELLAIKGNVISKSNWSKVSNLLKTTTNWQVHRNVHVSDIIHHFTTKSQKKYIEAAIKYYKKDPKVNPEILTKYYVLCDRILKNEIENIIHVFLRNTFNFDLCHIAILRDIIDFDEYRVKCIDYVKAHKKSAAPTFAGLKIVAYDYNLNHLINICYYKQVDLSSFQEFAGNSKYYKWLLDLPRFDYADFNPYWLLEYQTSVYFKEFAKIDQLREAVRNFIKLKPIKGLVSIYLNFFAS